MDVTSGTRMARLPYDTPNAGARVPPNETEDTFSSSEKGQVVDGGEGNGKEGEGEGQEAVGESGTMKASPGAINALSLCPEAAGGDGSGRGAVEGGRGGESGVSGGGAVALGGGADGRRSMHTTTWERGDHVHSTRSSHVGSCPAIFGGSRPIFGSRRSRVMCTAAAGGDTPAGERAHLQGADEASCVPSVLVDDFDYPLPDELIAGECPAV